MLPTLPTAENDLGSVLDNDTHTSAHENNVRRLIEALATSPEMRLFPLGLRVGDATNFIRANPATGRIEFGGTWRPTALVNLTAQFKSATDAHQDGLWGTIQFADAATQYVVYESIIVPANWDLTDNIVVTLPFYPDAALVSGVNDDVVVTWSVHRWRSGTSVKDAGERIVNATSTETLGNVAQYVNTSVAVTIAGSNFQAGDQINVKFTRVGNSGSDSLGCAIQAAQPSISARVAFVG